MAASKTMDWENISKGLKEMKFEVRGAIYDAAMKRSAAGKPVLFLNVGNPHALGQKPITFMRQVLSLVMAPSLMEDPRTASAFPSDAIARAKKYLAMMTGGVGAYSDSRGNGGVIEEIGQFLVRRDGIPPAPNTIFLTNGASEGVRMCLRALLTNSGNNRGVMTPIPQYPLYTASIQLYDGKLCGYYLDEASTWGMKMCELKRSIDEARSNGIEVVAMVFINPGNPTGQCLSLEDIQAIINFCIEEKLVLFADEVYQENLYTEKPFVSARKVLHDMGAPKNKQLELVSFHTTSKGAWGECGLRGGYFELMNVDPRTADELYKLASINLSPNAPGQVAMGVMTNPPVPGDESYPLYKREIDERVASLGRRAKMICDAFNSCEGITCQPTEGSMYSFPLLCLPKAAMDAADAAGVPVDVFYCLQLLDQTGISSTPGSAFSQVPGTFHLRVTILPPEEDIAKMMADFKTFHDSFMKQYRSPATPKL